jgi:hypothetical protein
MRVPLLPPTGLSTGQKNLYDDMVDVIEKNFGELVAYPRGRPDKKDCECSLSMLGSLQPQRCGGRQ